MGHDFSPYVPLSLIANGALDLEIVRGMWGWPRARWILTEDAAMLDPAVQAELLEAMRAGMPWDQRFLLVTTDPAKLVPMFADDVPPNVAVLAQITTQAEADTRLPALRECRAAVRGALVRPPSEPIDLSAHLAGLHWVISASIDTPVHPRRLDNLRQQCAAAGVPFWFDGWGDWVPISELWPPAPSGTEEGSVWYNRPNNDDLPMLIYKIGPKYRFRPTLDNRRSIQSPDGWQVPRMRADAPFVVGQVYAWEKITRYIEMNATADQTLLDSDGRLDGPFVVQNVSGAHLAAFENYDGVDYRCIAVGDALPAWATKAAKMLMNF